MIYEFFCDECGATQAVNSIPFEPPSNPYCCAKQSRRIYSAQIDTSGCKDADFIPETKRVADPVKPFSGEKKGRLFNKRIKERRNTYAREGQRGDMRHTHSVPADLYHGKIRETGDRRYWDDPKNMKRHESCRVAK